MDLDQEEPPALVNTNIEDVPGLTVGAPDPTTTQMEELSLTKVPLTIVTEFGDSADIEKSLTISQDDERVEDFLTLGNGCICCSVKDAGVNAIESLMARHATSIGTNKPFDHIILETSGLADPGNLVPLFWVDEGLGSSLYLDGVVCLVDAKNVLLSLDEPRPEEQSEQDKIEKHDVKHETVAHLQISGADVVVINKCDAVTPKQLEKVGQRIRSINGIAKIHETSYSNVPKLESFLLGLHAYDRVDTLRTEKRSYSHLDPTISTISLPIPRLAPSQLLRFEIWLRSILWDSILPSPSSFFPSGNDPLGTDGANEREYRELKFLVHRTKGRVVIADRTVKMVQGVREVFEIVDLDAGIGVRRSGDGYEDVKGKLILIGKGLDENLFKWSLEGNLAL
ncbi:MAG: hypothetical protein Q9217_002791 [Psora testacea]